MNTHHILKQIESKAKSTCLLVALMLFSTHAYAQATTDFVMTVKTDNAGVSGTTEFKIETDEGTAGYNYNVDVDNDGVYDFTGLTGDFTHDFGAVGTYTIRIADNVGDGTGFPRFFYNDVSDEEKILSIDQWGAIKWTNMQGAFYGATNLVLNATDTPDLALVTDFRGMFRDNSSLVDNGGQMNNWNMSTATTIQEMFSGATVFNSDISSWDVSNVTTFRGTFRSATAFNQNINTWNTSSALSMRDMFFWGLQL
ncbi:BspA family leucine-rich repeat surface protein [Ostreibacterium oceani]|uniref:BspA family leucine-rich repeat surface protein n=1 Tax=Ostreibacterium oceani TaxID=2654998 RepID=A0A6N7EVL6_9GAMM|nr:BspA family leucine-rich repeat surface protein [Ostreibacterium oceani]MPV86591.1 BspA family leucine-rich repeat surface protein [Ostreibacterium oceani]